MDKLNLAEKGVSVRDIFQEASIQRQLNHPNIVKFIDIRECPRGQFIYVMLEYCNQGTLKDWIEKQGDISPQELLDVFRQFSKGYHYMLRNFQNKQFVHRDIKSENLLLNTDA